MGRVERSRQARSARPAPKGRNAMQASTELRNVFHAWFRSVAAGDASLDNANLRISNDFSFAFYCKKQVVFRQAFYIATVISHFCCHNNKV